MPTKSTVPVLEYNERVRKHGFICDEDIFNVKQKITLIDKNDYKYFTTVNQVDGYGSNLSMVHKGSPYSMENIKLYTKRKFQNVTVLDNQEYLGSDIHFNAECNINNHGIFRTTWDKIKQDKNGICQKCSGDKKAKSKMKSLEDTVRDFKKVHGDRYNYDKVSLVDSSTKIKIICPTHGIFKQTPNSHVGGAGCSRCAFENSDHSGWSLSKWESSGHKSSSFSGFKTYLIRIWNDDLSEIFYKVGITYTTLEMRFESSKMPYNWEVIDILNFSDNAKQAFDLEKVIHRENKLYHYTPKVIFGGSCRECLIFPITLKDYII